MRRLFVFVVLFAMMGACPASAEDGPKELVTRYMQALRDRNYIAVAKSLGYDLPVEAAAPMSMLIDSQDKIVWQLKSFRIVDVHRDGGLATVTVQETLFRDLSPDLRALLAQNAPQFEKAVVWGDVVVNERFVLVRLDGGWQFDNGHSGVDVHRLFDTFKSLAEKNAVGPASQAMLFTQIGGLANTVGLGQLVQTFAAAGPTVPIIGAILIPNFTRARAQGQATACRSNLKNLGTALEMYSTDFGGRYPPKLSLLTPNYLRVIPTCPAAGTDTYSASYQSATQPEAFTVFCSGHHHQAVGYSTDFPKYTSVQGLLDR